MDLAAGILQAIIYKIIITAGVNDLQYRKKIRYY